MSIKNITVNGCLTKLINFWRHRTALKLAKRVMVENTPIVRAGPFSGLKFSKSIDAANNLPKLLGTYEKEIHPEIENILSRGFSSFVDVGTAEGYYAVGIGLRRRAIPIVGFEIDSGQRARCRETADLNGVGDRLTLLGKCDAKSLEDLELSNSFILMDCEGGEKDILTDELCPKLRTATLIVELHDALRPGSSRTVQEVLHKTHAIRYIEARRRVVDDCLVAELHNPIDKLTTMFESRVGVQEWAVCIPK